jgi:hypothetical protein
VEVVVVALEEAAVEETEEVSKDLIKDPQQK